jgi:hypothetical protein
MAQSLPASSRMWDSYIAYKIERAQGAVTATDLEQNLYYDAATLLLGDEDPEIILTLELGGEVWTVVVVGDGVRLLRVLDEQVEMRFLGELTGDYVETFRFVDNARELTMQFKDARLPGNVLEVTDRQTDPHAITRRGTLVRSEEVTKLNKKLREWASRPPAFRS